MTIQAILAVFGEMQMQNIYVKHKICVLYLISGRFKNYFSTAAPIPGKGGGAHGEKAD